MDAHSINLYLNFAIQALHGGNPGAVDSLYKQHRRDIDPVIEELHGMFQTPLHKVWRGILLDGDKYIQNGHLIPLDHVTYMSFTEDLNVAKEFADPNDPMAFTVMKKYPNSKGYIMEVHPTHDQVMFHWKWAKFLKIEAHVDMHVIEQQKEVIIKQIGHRYKLTPFVSGVHGQLQDVGLKVLGRAIIYSQRMV